MFIESAPYPEAETRLMYKDIMAEHLTIEEQFNLIAKEYDSGRRKFIPCFDDYYEKTTDFAASFAGNPRRIMDLGSGTGLLAMYYFRHFPDAEYILADMAKDMLNVARKRFEHAPQVSFQVIDYTQELPEGNFDLVISALSIHHLENQEKSKLFGKIREKLLPGSFFINYDQFCCDSFEMSRVTDQYWVDHLYRRSGLTPAELALWEERRKLDRECSVTEEKNMLLKSGFKMAECIYLCGKFAVIAAQV
jgi:ubiquinone/menaquinone biosynthesis C-methylase UbiE